MHGTVVKVFGRYYTVKKNEDRYNCVLRGKIRKDKRLKRFSDPVATGDTVEFEIDENNEGVINSILDRRNVFSRKDKSNRKEDLIASNLDYIIVIQSIKLPKLNLRFVDRLHVRGEKEGIPVILCVNKIDLADGNDTRYVTDYYRNTNLKIIFTSALTGKGLDELKSFTRGKISIFTGYSGVGKSTILNSLYPGLNIKTTEISTSTGKGKHTTTNVEMIIPENGTGIMDTPGLREFGLMDIEPKFLGNYFHEFKDYLDECSFRTCTHDHEPGCEIKKQVNDGNISEERYISYLNIYHSLKEHYDNMY